MVFRASCLLVGTALVILSLFGFTTGQILASSILLTIGYAIATSWWLISLISWTRPPKGPDLEEVEYLAATRRPIQSGAVRPVIRPVNRLANDDAVPAPHFGLSSEIANQSLTPAHVPAHSAANPLPADDVVRLQCSPCGKQFHVRGQGEIAYRLVPCPECGTAMESLGPIHVELIPTDPAWMPIVSVLCKECHGLIDVPYSTFGTLIPCPRCHADMHVPFLFRY
jgi:hypothetical protein